MNDLINAMSTDMGIVQYEKETESSFIYRICYSALGQWCLQISLNSFDDISGTSKNNQTKVLNRLINHYCEMFPSVKSMFEKENNTEDILPVHIRKVYQQTGYLLTDKRNYNYLANFGRSVSVGKEHLYFGIPSVPYLVNGLGIFAPPTKYQSSINEILIRDELTSDEYFKSRFDSIYFYEKQIDISELQFFDPLANKSPSQAWSLQMTTDCTIAKCSRLGTYYRVIKEPSGQLIFADELSNSQEEAKNHSLILYEYRRLLYAIKKHYENALVARIYRLDNNYSSIFLQGHLPNREYYFLLLLAWPADNAYNKRGFIIKNQFISTVITMFKNIGINVEGGTINV